MFVNYISMKLTFKNHNFLLKFSYYFPIILFNDLAIQHNVTFYQLNREKNPCTAEVESLINPYSEQPVTPKKPVTLPRSHPLSTGQVLSVLPSFISTLPP